MTSPKPEPMTDVNVRLAAANPTELLPREDLVRVVRELQDALDAERAARAEAEGKLSYLMSLYESTAGQERIADLLADEEFRRRAEDEAAAHIAVDIREWAQTIPDPGQRVQAKLFEAADRAERGDWRR